MGAPDGTRQLRHVISGPAMDAEQLGQQLAARLLADGAGEILAACGAVPRPD